MKHNLKIILSIPFLFSVGCMNFTTDISHTDRYSEMTGKNVYLVEGKCLYWAVSGEWAYEKYSIEHFPIEETNICNDNLGVPDLYKAVEILPKDTKIKSIKTLREKDAGGSVWDYGIGSVYSKKLKREIQFEYFYGLSNNPDPIPWTLEKPND